MRTIQREIVAGLIVSKDGKFLFGKKDPKGGGVYVDCWHTPGGGIEKNESLLEALQRELLEEVGVDISPYKVELLDDSDTGFAEKTLKETGEKVMVEMRFHVYRILIRDKTSEEIKISLNDDLAEYQWVAPEDLRKIKITPPSVKLFLKLGYL